MFSTRDVIEHLRVSNPDSNLSEDRIRHALRAGKLPWPRVIGGRLIWTEADIIALSRVFDLDRPNIGERGIDS